MIAAYIKQALSERSSVIVPDLGTFTLVQAHAQISPSGSLIKPPGNTIEFSTDTYASFNSIVDFIAEKEEKSPDEIAVLVGQEVAILKGLIANGEKAELQGVGYLQHAEASAIEDLVFTPADEPGLSAAAFGLPNITARPLLETPEAAQSESAKKEQKPLVVLWLVLIPLLLLGGVLGYFYLNPDAYERFKGDTNQAAAKPAQQPVATDTLPATGKPVETDGNSAAATNTQPQAKEAAKQTTSGQQAAQLRPQADDAGTTAAKTTSARYYLIISSFAQRDKAEGYVKELKGKGFDGAKVVEKGDGKFRVSLDDFSNMNEAAIAADSYKAQYEGVWVLKY